MKSLAPPVGHVKKRREKSLLFIVEVVFFLFTEPSRGGVPEIKIPSVVSRYRGVWERV
jgi:hypothetical protein